MADKFIVNPFTGRLDDVGKYFGAISSAPTGKSNGYMAVVGDTLYYFAGGNRYKITAVIDNPAGSRFLQEDGSSFILLEDGSSKLLLEA
jgi:hypothetical protein